MNPSEPEEKDLNDDSYGAADFKNDAFGGRLRWFASLCAAASIGMLLWFWCGSQVPMIYFPLNLAGAKVVWAVAASAIFWLVIAVWNWRAWSKKRRR